MEVTHIIPLSLNKFDDSASSNTEIVGGVLSFSRLTHLRRQTDAARTWDMLQSWTQIDFRTYVGPNINLPTNAIYMTREEHVHFGCFQFYLDKEAVSLFRGGFFLLSLALTHFSTRIFPTSTKYVCPENARF
jgi:hypothetical protein